MRSIELGLRNARALWRRYVGLGLLLAVGTAGVLALTTVTAGTDAVTRQRVTEGVALRSIQVLPRPDLPTGARLTTVRVHRLAALGGVADVEGTLQATIGIKTAAIPGALLHATVLRPSAEPPLLGRTRPRVFPLSADEVVLPARAQGIDLSGLLGHRVPVDFQRTTGAAQGVGAHGSVVVVGLYDPSWQLEGPDAAFGSTAQVVRWAASVAGVPAADLLATAGYDRATVVATSSARVPDLVRELQQEGFGASSLRDQLAQLPSVLRLIRTLSRVLVVALLLLVFLASLSLTGALVRQRTREIGLLKAVGYRDGGVFRMLLAESGAVGLVAVVTGVGAGAAAGSVLAHLLTSSPDLAPFLAQRVLPGARELALVVGVPLVAVVAGGLLPARRAARLEPAVALRDW